MASPAFYIICRTASDGTVIDRRERIPRYWKHKEIGTTVEVTRFLRDVSRNQYRVIFFDPELNQQFNMPLRPGHKNPFQPLGARTPLLEDAFTDHYEPVGNISAKF